MFKFLRRRHFQFDFHFFHFLCLFDLVYFHDYFRCEQCIKSEAFHPIRPLSLPPSSSLPTFFLLPRFFLLFTFASFFFYSYYLSTARPNTLAFFICFLFHTRPNHHHHHHRHFHRHLRAVKVPPVPPPLRPFIFSPLDFSFYCSLFSIQKNLLLSFFLLSW